MTTLEKATIWKMNQWILGHFFDKTMWQSTKWPDPLRLDGRCAPFFFRARRDIGMAGSSWENPHGPDLQSEASEG